MYRISTTDDPNQLPSVVITFLTEGKLLLYLSTDITHEPYCSLTHNRLVEYQLSRYHLPD